MVRPAHRRTEKYKKNIDPDQTKRKLERVRGVMIDLETPYLAQIAEVERKVKRICERQGVATHLIAQYINFARQVYSKSKRFESATLNAEIQYLVDLWVSRGLLGAKLIEISGLFGVTPTAPLALTFNPYIQYPTLPVMSPLGGVFPSAYWCGLTGGSPPWSGDLVCNCMPVLRRFRIDRLVIFFNGDLGAPRKFRLTLYDDNGHCYPNSVLEDSGAVNMVLNHLTYYIPVDRWLEKGIYWLGWQYTHDDGSMIYNDVHPAPIGVDAIGTTWANYATWVVTQPFGAPPNPFPIWTNPNVWWDNWLYSVGWRIVELG